MTLGETLGPVSRCFVLGLLVALCGHAYACSGGTSAIAGRDASSEASLTDRRPDANEVAPDAADSADHTAPPPAPDAMFHDAEADGVGNDDAGASYTVSVRTQDAYVFRRAGKYDYHPDVMFDGLYRMWWCGQNPAGDFDHILYAEASSPAGPWHARRSTVAGSFDDVFQPSGPEMATFDARHTCDPHVIRHNGTYYMYYGGTPNYERFGSTVQTFIGVATSSDGYTWRRANGGRPIVEPYDRHDPAPSHVYGAGVPSVVYRDGHFYMLYLDTTGRGGPATYAIRSPDPLLQTGVEELVPSGSTPQQRTWVPRTRATMTQAVVIGSGGWEWQYSDALDLWIVSKHNTVVFWRGDLTSVADALPRYTVPAAVRRDHPGIMHRWDGHAIPSRDVTFAPADCGIVPIYYFGGRSTAGTDPPSAYDLSMMSFDLITGRGCDQWNIPALFEGSVVATSSTDFGLVRGGRRLGFERLEAAMRLARARYNLAPSIAQRIPSTGHTVRAGAAAWVRTDTNGQPTGHPAVLATDGASGRDERKYVYTCAEFAAANGSSLQTVSASRWASVTAVGTLWCVW